MKNRFIYLVDFIIYSNLSAQQSNLYLNERHCLWGLIKFYMDWKIYSYLFLFAALHSKLYFLGCPSRGHYGENCSIPCPQNCLEGHCDIEEGTCLGCKTGYKRSKCNEGKLFRLHDNAVTINLFNLVIPFIF